MRPPMVFADIARLAAICVAGRSGRVGLLQFAAVLACGLLGVQVSVRLISWTADFYNALQRLDGAEAVRQMLIFFALIAASSGLFLAGAYIRKLLQIRWRKTLTDAALSAWLDGKAFWHFRDSADSGLHNPDQRISEDCRIFVDKLTGEGLELLTNLVALASYVAILWSLSTFPLPLQFMGLDAEIPRYMVWAAPIYVALASGLTHWLGSPLAALAFEQQRREADFRFALVRVRENAEAVALSEGELAERRTLDARFAAIASNWGRLNKREFILGLFTRPYFSTVLRIPLFLALPAFLAGRVTFGGLMQLGSAFQNVVTTLSWFIFSYKDLAELAATSGRLSAFFNTMRNAGSPAPGIELIEGAPGRWVLRSVTLATPQGRPLLAVKDLVLRAGETVWISAPSGTGKSTLVKALAGLWTQGTGRIERPRGERICYMPQQVYVPIGCIPEAVAYPTVAPTEPCATEALARVGLDRLNASASSGAQSTELLGLSGGERQRLALARLMLQRPDWAFLDEATSALDAAAEEAVFSSLRASLPRTTLIVIAHREPKGLGPCRRIDLASGTAVPEELVGSLAQTA